MGKTSYWHVLININCWLANAGNANVSRSCTGADGGAGGSIPAAPPRFGGHPCERNRDLFAGFVLGPHQQIFFRCADGVQPALEASGVILFRLRHPLKPIRDLREALLARGDVLIGRVAATTPITFPLASR